MRVALASSPGFPALGGAWGRGYIGLGPGSSDRSLCLTSTVLHDVGLHCQASASVSRDFKLLDPSALIWPNVDHVQLLY